MVWQLGRPVANGRSHRGSSQTSYSPGSSRCCRSSRGGLIIPGGSGWMTGRSCRILFVLDTRPGAYRWIVEHSLALLHWFRRPPRNWCRINRTAVQPFA
jgi:hypothetical protein